MILEGTYPYVHGGVSAWVHQLIINQPDLTFFLICILPQGFNPVKCFELPPNVTGIKHITLAKIDALPNPLGLPRRKFHRFFKRTTPLLLKQVSQKADVHDFRKIVNQFRHYRRKLDEKILLSSPPAWNQLLEIYSQTMPEISFIDFFWSWRTLVGGMFSMLVPELPDVRCFHTVCTGYAGLIMARAKHELDAPCILTEHGIYTSERRFEIAFAEWLIDQKSFSMSVNKSNNNYELRDLWTDFFVQYGQFCYSSADAVISLFRDNMQIQIDAGAPPEKCKVIPNGIDLKRYGNIPPSYGHLSTIAFIGRIVPIKDVKTYIRAVAILRRNISDLKAYIIGGYDEDPDYYEECLELIRTEELEKVIILTGKVDIVDYLPQIDVVVLSSISEAQPLVILEAGAAGIPSVATNVGACREMLEGANGDDFGPGGIVVPLASPAPMADALFKLLSDEQFYARCSGAIKQRVEKYYSSEDQHRAYRELYTQIMKLKD
jgi:glycosyltransferase involved in cell wall biosynthesis